MSSIKTGAGIHPNNIYYYRNKDKNEVDIIIESGGVLYPVEIKKHSNPTKKDAENFALLRKFAKVGEGAVICQCDRPMPLDEAVTALPVWYI